MLTAIQPAKVWQLIKHLDGPIDLLISSGVFRRNRRRAETFAVGHFAIGYIFSKLAAQATKTKVNIPLVLTLSIIPDVDILVPWVEHRGPFHSIIMAVIIFIPVFALHRKAALPYFVALAQHSLVSDYVAGGQVQLLWPLTSRFFGIETCITSLANVLLEWAAFILATAIMWVTKDIRVFVQPHSSNLVLAIPTFTVLLPTLFAFPLEVPITLIPPHIVYLILFLTSILIDLKSNWTHERPKFCSLICQ